MAVTAERMAAWCRNVVANDPEAGGLTFEQYLQAVPRLESLADLPSGTVVLVRGDVDAKVGDEVGKGDIRLRSMVDTLKYGLARGWKMVVLGHIGRKPDGTLAKVAKRLGRLLQIEVPLIEDWLDNQTGAVLDAAAQTVAAAKPGSVLVLQNTRKYPNIETPLWKAGVDDCDALAPILAKYANDMATKFGAVYVHEGLSAGSLDASSVVLPAAMKRVALGKYIAAELEGPMPRCRNAEILIFSGLKADKLDDLENIMDRGKARVVFCAGSLAMSLKKAACQLLGDDFCVGVAQDPARVKEADYIPADRIEQAKRILRKGLGQGVDFVLPVDFVLGGQGGCHEKLGERDQQFDVGERTCEVFANKVTALLAAGAERVKQGDAPIVFHNGVFGKFEDEAYSHGTRRFMQQLKRLRDGGFEVYIGGGEGGEALEKYGAPDWITHCFTAGGTVLNAMGSAPIPYLVALRMAAKK